MSASVKQSDGAPLKIEVKRAGNTESFTITPVHVKEPSAGVDSAQWVIGVLPRGDATTERESPFRAVPHAVTGDRQDERAAGGRDREDI